MTYRRSRPRSTGYSLVELMIAIGILGIGLAMAAALFPAGLRQNEVSIQDSLGTLICDNGVALVKALKYPLKNVGTGGFTEITGSVVNAGNSISLTYAGMRHLAPLPYSNASGTAVQAVPSFRGDWNSATSVTCTNGNILRDTQDVSDVRLARFWMCLAGTQSIATTNTWVATWYGTLVAGNEIRAWVPVSRASIDPKAGVAVLARQMTANANDYVFVITSYSTTRGDRDAGWYRGQVSFGDKSATFNSSTYLRRDGPVVQDNLDPGNGRVKIAKITYVSGDTASLTATLGSGSGWAWILCETSAGSQVSDAPCPALATVVVRTALKL